MNIFFTAEFTPIRHCLMFCLGNNKKRQAVKTLVVEAQEIL